MTAEIIDLSSRRRSTVTTGAREWCCPGHHVDALTDRLERAAQDARGELLLPAPDVVAVLEEVARGLRELRATFTERRAKP